MFNNEIPNIFPNMENKARMFPYTILLNVLEDVDSAVKVEKEISFTDPKG